MSTLAPKLAFSIGPIQWCKLKLQAKALMREAGNDSDYEKGKIYNVVTKDGTFRAKFLGHELLMKNEGFFDELIFQNIKTLEITRIERKNLRGNIDDSYKAGGKYRHNKHYKFMTRDSQIVNGIYLGQSETPSSKNKKIAILNTDTGKIENYFEWEIFHAAFNKAAQDKADFEAAKDPNSEPTFTITVTSKREEFELPVTTLAHKQNPNFKAGVDPALLAKMSPDQVRRLNDFINLSFEYVSRYDANMRRVFPMQRLDDNLAIHYLDNNRSPYTYSTEVPINGQETRFIRMSLDLTREDLGLDVSVVLHERGHHYGTNNSIATRSGISLLEDSAYREGLADYFVAHEMKDPAIGRSYFSNAFWLRNIERRQELVGNETRVIKSPLDATLDGTLEPHALSIFYSYPMWKAFVGARQESLGVKAPDLWKNFHAKMETAYTKYQSIKNQERANNTLQTNAESERIQNIEFFYSYLYYEAYLNPQSTTEQKSNFRHAYNEAKKAFILPWKQIESNALKLN